jgi:hypothetical protein
MMLQFSPYPLRGIAIEKAYIPTLQVLMLPEI